MTFKRNILHFLFTTALVVLVACSDDSVPDAPGDNDTIADPEPSPCEAGYRQDHDLPTEFLDDYPDGCVPQECGLGRWGNLEVDGNTVFVDVQAEEGGDGSEQAPFTSIQDGLDAVGKAGGGMVAVAAGTYVENLLLSQDHNGVHLAGRCRELVVTDGSGGEVDEHGIRGEGPEPGPEWHVSAPPR